METIRNQVISKPKIYKPGQKIKLMIDTSDKSYEKGKERTRKKLCICTVVKQYPHVVHITYPSTDGTVVSTSMTPWELEKYRAK